MDERYPSVETERLLLRPFEPDDLDELAALHAEPSFWWYPLRRGQTRDETERFIATQLQRYETDGVGLWAAVDRASGALAGWLGLAVPHFLPAILPAVEVGWRLGTAWRGQGLATEGATAALDFGFGVLGLDEIVSIYEPENEASGRVMQRLGLTFRRALPDPHGVTVHVLAVDRHTWGS